ncbi:esterase/lipase family protein [Bacillus toyonensis]|uniref:esterase/lipase family protein n=1 Tax=Bacillus toyonensis TaxID=155322 RepID=UPI003F65CA89
MQSFLLILFFAIICSISSVSAETNPDYGKVFPPKETFRPGDWFVGATPAQVDPTKAPIVFVQGKNGKANDWYGDTYYHGKNNMYDRAYYAGYQTAFVQLYDAAGTGSVSPWTNGKLLAEKLEAISQHFGQKVNIIAYSKGGIDTQAALVQYGAHRFVDKVITLGSPHYGTYLADLSYSWWAGWLASLLGQQDEGTYALQTGEMSRFRSIIDTNPVTKSNQYYTIAGTSWGPTFSALSVGGLYLSPYGNNDGLVSEWSTTLPYGAHLFSDPTADHDSIRTGTAVFSRIEPYLRTKKMGEELLASSSPSTNEPYTELGMTENQTVLGGELVPHQENRATFSVDTLTPGTVSILTASKQVEIQLISPSGKVYNKQEAVLTTGDDTFFKGSSIHTFQIKSMEIGEWKIGMNTEVKDAYLAMVQYQQEAPFYLKMPAKAKANQAKFQIQSSDEKPVEAEDFSMTVRVVDRTGALISQSDGIQRLDANTLSTTLQNIEQSGVYNLTIDVKGKNKEGRPYTRTIIRSMYIEK